MVDKKPVKPEKPPPEAVIVPGTVLEGFICKAPDGEQVPVRLTVTGVSRGPD